MNTMRSTLLRLVPVASLAMLLAAAPQVAPAAEPPAQPKAPAPRAAPPKPSAPALKELPVEGAKPTAKDVFARAVEATGGAKAWEAKSGCTTSGAMEVPSAGLKGSMTTAMKAPNKMLVTTEIPGMGSARQGFDGTTGWGIDPMRGPALMGPDELAQVKRDADFRRELTMSKDPGKAEVVGLFEFDGAPCWQVRLDPAKPTGPNYFYAKDTGLMRGMTMVAATPMGDIPVTMVMTDYKDFGDVKMAARSVTRVMGQEQVITVEKADWTAPADSTFDLPAEVAALKAGGKAPGDAIPVAPADVPAKLDPSVPPLSSTPN